MGKIVYKEESYAIVGAAMKVYNQLGSGFLEAVYQEALGVEFDLRSIPFQEQVSLAVRYKGHPLKQRYIAGAPHKLYYERIIF